MAIKAKKALTAFAAVAKVNEASLHEMPGGWLALGETPQGKRLLFTGTGTVTKYWQTESMYEAEGINVQVLLLNANNAAVLRRFLKRTEAKALGAGGITVGFSDWTGMAAAYVADCFSLKQARPILAELTAADCTALGSNFLTVADAVTWGLLTSAYQDSFGLCAAGLTEEEDIVKALLYGYSMIGLDSSGKIDCTIAALDDSALTKRYEALPETFRAALAASYLKADLKVADSNISFTEKELERSVLMYGSVIMHSQFIYNSYLKNTPWPIDFLLELRSCNVILTPQAHYLIANELERNGVRLCAVSLNVLPQELEQHCRIAAAFDYRLVFANAENSEIDIVKATKLLKGRAHFRLENLLWRCALELIAQSKPALFAELRNAVAVPQTTSDADALPLLLPAYRKLLAANTAHATAIKDLLKAESIEYSKRIREATNAFLNRLD